MNSSPPFGALIAERAIATMRDEVTRRGSTAVFAVCDGHGELVAFLRMDGTRLSSINVAINKAFTAARAGEPTGALGAQSRDPVAPFDIAYFGDKRMVGWPGGLPVQHGTTIVAAVAVSGLSEEQDEEVARIGVSVILGGPCCRLPG